MKYIFIGLIIILIIIFINYYFKHLLFKRIQNKLFDIFYNASIKFTLKQSKDSGCDWLIETETDIYICKLFQVNTSANLIITNTTTWILAKDSEAIKIENRIKNVNHFVNYNPSSNKNIHKIAILHPSIKQIRKYINENEMIIINLDEEVDGFHFISSKNFNSIIKK